MIPLRSIPTLAISIAALLFVAWMASMSLVPGGLYASRPPTLTHSFAFDPSAIAPRAAGGR
jgi:hypothetical protein